MAASLLFGNTSQTVILCLSASWKSSERGMSVITGIPVASENLPISFSSRMVPRLFRTSPAILPWPSSNPISPRMMLLAAYRDIGSPEVTMMMQSAKPFLIGTANPPHTTSPRTS